VGIVEIVRYLFQTYEVFDLLIHGASLHYLVFNRIVSFDSFSVKRFKKIRVSSVFVIFFLMFMILVINYFLVPPCFCPELLNYQFFWKVFLNFNAWIFDLFIVMPFMRITPLYSSNGCRCFCQPN
jgi:hypothetical protein